MTRLPQSYVPATWRNVTPVDAEAEAIGIGLNLPSGTVRVALGVEGARQLVEALTEYLERGRETTEDSTEVLQGRPRKGQAHHRLPAAVHTVGRGENPGGGG